MRKHPRQRKYASTANSLVERRRQNDKKFYQSPEWRGIREMVLDGEPYCRTCSGAGRVALATDIDHIKPRSSISPSATPEDAIDNLQPLCHSCHSKKTATERANG